MTLPWKSELEPMTSWGDSQPYLPWLSANLSVLMPAHFSRRELNLSFHCQLNCNLLPSNELAMCWNSFKCPIYVICVFGACLTATATNSMQQQLMITVSWEQSPKNFKSFKHRISKELSVFLPSFLFLQSMR